MVEISNIYIPIEYSNLPKIISEDDEILYSTLCNAEWQTGSLKASYKTHLIVTKKGIAYTAPLEYEGKKQTKDFFETNKELNFFTWAKIYEYTYSKFKKNKIYFNRTWFKVIRNEKYESEVDFKSRENEFGPFCEKLFNAEKGEYYTHYIEKTSEIYVPVKYSIVYNYIPRREKIIYSTICNANMKQGNVSFSWTTHVLITESSIAYIYPILTRRLNIDHFEPIRYPWNKIRGSRISGIIKFKNDTIYINNIKFQAARIIQYESPEIFNSRKNKFGPLCEVLYNNYRNYISNLTSSVHDLINIEKISENNYNLAIDKARELLHAELASDANNLLNHILSQLDNIISYEKQSYIWYLKGKAFKIYGHNEEALKCFNKALTQDPTNIRALRKKYLMHMDEKEDLVDYRDINSMKTLFKDDDSIVSMLIKTDGKYVINGSAGNYLKMWDLSTGDLIQTYGKHQNARALAISPDGNYLLSGSWNGKLKMWDIKTGELHMNLKKHKGSVNSLLFTPDGKYIISGSSDSNLRIWEFSTGNFIHKIKAHKSSVRSMTIHPSGKFLTTCSADYHIKIWEIMTWELLNTLKGHRGSVNSVAISPDGNYLISGSDDKEIGIWDFSSGELLKKLSGHQLQINSVAITPDGLYIISGSRDKFIKIWDLSKGDLIQNLVGHIGEITSVSATPDGKYIISSSRDKNIIVWKNKLPTWV